MYTYGPVLSRRLGYSLGIDIVRGRACTLNCVYCQIGSRGPHKPERKSFIPVEALEAELREKIAGARKIDYVTFAGTGEPTLSSDLGEYIRFIKENYPELRVAVLTNGSLLYREDVREELAIADLVVPSLDAPDAETWKKVNRPHPDLDWDRFIAGLVRFSQEFRGTLKLEIMLVKGLNDSDESLAGLHELVMKIGADEIDINTPVRPPAEEWVSIPDDDRIARAKELIGGSLIGSRMGKSDAGARSGNIRQQLLDFLSRRPETLENIVSGLGGNRDEIEQELFALLGENAITKSIRQDKVFYWKRG